MLEAKSEMDVGTLCQYGGMAMQLIAAGILQLCPKERMIGRALLGIGWLVFIVSSAIFVLQRVPTAFGWFSIALGWVLLPLLFLAVARFGFGSLSLADAAELLVKKIENSPAADALLPSDRNAERMLTEAGNIIVACGVPIYGIRVPEKKKKMIPVNNLRDIEMRAVTSDAVDTTAMHNIIYSDIRVRRRDLYRSTSRLVS